MDLSLVHSLQSEYNMNNNLRYMMLACSLKRQLFTLFLAFKLPELVIVWWKIPLPNSMREPAKFACWEGSIIMNRTLRSKDCWQEEVVTKSQWVMCWMRHITLKYALFVKGFVFFLNYNCQYFSETKHQHKLTFTNCWHSSRELNTSYIVFHSLL